MIETKRSGKFKHIAVLMGGLSKEHDVSITTGNGVVEALQALGYEKISPVIVDNHVSTTLANLKPDAAFNALHGNFGEDGCIQGILEYLRIPYTHSGVTTSALAMHKAMTKQLLSSAGIPTPAGQYVDRNTLITMLPNLIAPYVIKPNSEGSSIGVLIAKDRNAEPFTERDISDHSHFLVEDYIPGLELSCAVLDSGPLGVIELEPINSEAFYDYTRKYEDNQTNHYTPARIDDNLTNDLMDLSFQAHKLLECRHISRSDFRYNPDTGQFFLMEVNTHPGLTKLSIVPEIAAYRNISFNELILYLTEHASCEK